MILESEVADSERIARRMSYAEGQCALDVERTWFQEGVEGQVEVIVGLLPVADSLRSDETLGRWTDADFGGLLGIQRCFAAEGDPEGRGLASAYCDPKDS